MMSAGVSFALWGRAIKSGEALPHYGDQALAIAARGSACPMLREPVAWLQ